MPWPKKKADSGGMSWEQDICQLEDVARVMAQRAKDRWLTKQVVYCGENRMLIVSMQSAQYAPKVTKAKKPKAEDAA